MKLLCAALLVLLGHQALTKPRRVEHQPTILIPGPVENPKVNFGKTTWISKVVKGKPFVFTGKPWVIEPWNENAALLDQQTLLNPKFEQMLVKLKSMPTWIPEARKRKPKVTTGKPKVTSGKPKVTTGKPKVTTGKPRVIEPWNENTAFLDRKTQLNPKMEQTLHKHISMPVENLNDCKEGEFQCDTDLCVSEEKRCDGRVNCADGTDEVDCDQVDVYQETGKRESRQGCGGEISHTSGTFNHPNDGGNYQNDEDCVWIIRAGQPIKITFTRFQVENRYDNLIIRDGDNSGSSVLSGLTGHTIPNPVETSGNAAYLQFTSDYSVSFTGFEIQWEPLGCGGEYTTSNGVITHPLDGGSYGNRENCIWKIQAAEPIKITFVRFGLELNYDFLYLRDGESSASSLLGSFTGDNLPMYVESSQNSAFIRFTSDYSIASTGFELRWEPSPKVTTCQCGVANTERIIGGTEVNPKRKYPWQIGLRKPGYYISCGGTIINDRWILTAAHCITDQKTCRLNNDADLKVLVGEHNQVDGNDDATDTTQYSIKTFIKHPNYNCDTLDYDFALLELTEAIPFNSIIRPICLPEDDSETYAGQTGIVTGWGLTTDFTVKGTVSDFLNVVQVSIFANDDCKTWGTIADMKICASVGSCKGDSGGPMHVIKNGKFVQVGVVSYGSGSGCTAPGFPAVYARVSKVLPWISTTTSNGKKCD